MFWGLNFEFPIDVRLAHSLLEEDDVVRYESNGETALLLETVKSIHYLGFFVTLRSDL